MSGKRVSAVVRNGSSALFSELMFSKISHFNFQRSFISAFQFAPLVDQLHALSRVSLLPVRLMLSHRTAGL